MYSACDESCDLVAGDRICSNIGIITSITGYGYQKRISIWTGQVVWREGKLWSDYEFTVSAGAGSVCDIDMTDVYGCTYEYADDR